MPATSSPHDLALEHSIKGAFYQREPSMKSRCSEDGAAQGQEPFPQPGHAVGSGEGRPAFGSSPRGGTIEEGREEDGAEYDEVAALDREVSLIQLSARGVRNEAQEMGQGGAWAAPPEHDHPHPFHPTHVQSQ
eukprot:scaffold114082_cov19-Tisochrysis_lutea.AAC.1